MTLNDFRPAAGVSWGNILTLITLIFAGGVAYADMRGTALAHMERTSRIEAEKTRELSRLETALEAERLMRRQSEEALVARVRAAEAAIVRADERHAAILTALGRIEARMQREGTYP